jgi:hypothetical protein
MIVQESGGSARTTIAAIANIIEFNPAWKEIWPEIVPDKEQAWGVEAGFEVKRTDIDYVAWRTLRDKEGKDRTLVGYGADSGEIVGKHPTNCLFLDDIHDQRNTSSLREMESIKANIRANLGPCITPGKTFPAIIFTPWKKDDAYQELLRTGLFRHIKTPVFREDPEGKDVFEGQNVKLAWPEFWDIKKMEWARRFGPSEFARAYLLDLDKASQRMFKWMAFKSEEISPMWPMVCGVDYASVFSPGRAQGGGSSHFAMCYTLKLPQGGAVVYDGIVEKCSQAEAETYVFRAQEGYRGFLSAVIEMDGKGQEFASLIKRNPKLKVIPMWTKGRSKDDRVWGEMGPWLENGVVRISDADTPFLNHLRRFLNEYPDLDRNDPARDVADSLYWSLMGMPDVLNLPAIGDELPSIRKIKTVNPAKFLGSFHDNHP